jgi:hypothetical protein
LRASEIAKIIKMNYPNGTPLCILGPSGVGKSQIVAQVGNSLGMGIWGKEDTSKGAIYTFNLLIQDIVAMHGLPYPAPDSFVDWIPPRELPLIGNNTFPDSGFIIFDEFNTASRAKQTLLYDICLNRKIGNNRLKEGWYPILIGNRAEDRGEIHDIPGPLMNRVCIIYMDVNVKEWISWASWKEVDPRIIGYIAQSVSGNLDMSSSLYDNPSGRVNLDTGASRPLRIGDLWYYDETRMIENWPTPRAWGENVDFALKHGILEQSEAVRREVLGGMIGKTCAQSFLTYCLLYNELPQPHDILTGKKTFPAITNAGLCFAAATSIVEHVKNRSEAGKPMLKELLELLNSGTVTADFIMLMITMLTGYGMFDEMKNMGKPFMLLAQKLNLEL